MKRIFVFLAIIFPLFLTACGGSSGDNSDSTPPQQPSEVPNEVARGDLTPEGGIILVVPGDTAELANTKIEIPADAAIEALQVQVGYEDDAPGPFRAEANDASVTQVSKTIVLHVVNGGPSTFNKPVKVTMPYDAEAAGGLPPAVLYWDPDADRYRPVSVIGVDAAASTVTFLTSHFSRFIAVVVKLLEVDVPNVDTGFRLGTDSVLHHNFGSYERGGHCMAFASLSSHYYSHDKITPLYAFAQEGEDEQPADDEITRTAITLIYALLEGHWQSVATNVLIPSAKNTGLLMLESMIVTGDPVHMTMFDNNETEGHAVTVYGYDADTARFLIYDNNFPKTEVTFDWNLLTGFGRYSREDAYESDMFDQIGYTTNDTYGAPAEFDKIIADWENGNLQDYYDNLEVTHSQGSDRLSFNESVVATIPYLNDQNIMVHFTRPSGSTDEVYMHVYLDGVKQSAAAPALDASGNFKVSFPTRLEDKVEVMLLVSQHPRSILGGFSAFGKFTVQPEGKNFFVNLGFESGDATGWSSETTLRSSGRIWTPTKLQVVGRGFDPIATDIPTAIFGHYAVRVNDDDPSFHVTYLSQKAVVPNTSNPQLVFQWAAVLEDPRHRPDDQPYVDVVVRNLTERNDLYRKRFYTNDPGFIGWKEYQRGTWKAIPWQSVLLTGLTEYAGDELELRIDGADCDLGAHGGYVYIDGEE